MGKDNDNIIIFPTNNPELSIDGIAITQEETKEKIKQIKLAFFSSAADEILENVIRSIGSLGITDKSKEIETRDIIMLKESIISVMCRITDVSHPLHKISEDEIMIDLNMHEELDDMFFDYKFKSEIEEELNKK
jgi:hypothetical protein